MLRTRLVVLGAATAVLLGLLVASGPEESADEAELSGVASITLTGRGYGHGRGLSQYAAQNAAANHARNHQQILDFYYPGTAVGRAAGWIRVLLTGQTYRGLQVRDRRNLRARSITTGQAWVLDHPDARIWVLRPSADNRTTQIWARGERWHHIRNVRGAVEFLAGGFPLEVRTPSGWHPYRGRLRSAIDGSDRDTVNVVVLEQYLRGVVPREMPPLWHPEAVRAQSVAARTYAAFERRQPRGHHFDVYDTVSSQVYGGVESEHPAATDAINATRAAILTHDGKPAFTQFSASNGGWTVPGSEPYQQARWDKWDRWPGNPHRWWRTTLKATTIERAYPRIGDFLRLRVFSSWRDGRGQWGGRVLRIRIVGNRDIVTMSGSDFRFRFGLKSTWFTAE